jgi:hypothetical protein
VIKERPRELRILKHGAEMIWVLGIFGSLKCYDPRDVVFALRSLTPALKSVIPDYSLSTTEVFISAARAIIMYQ